MEENWVITVDSPKYEVSNLGNIRHIERKKNLNLCYGHSSGYVTWAYRKDNKLKRAYVHRTVYASFNEIEIPKDKEINHLDFDPTNCRLDNLEMITRRENIDYSRKNGRFDEANKKQSELYKQKAKNGELDYFIKKTPEQLKKQGKSISKRWKELGHPMKGKKGFDHPGRKFTKDEYILIKQLYNSGIKMLEIHQKQGFALEVIYSICKGSNKNLL